jgi:hypothetical protein
MPTCRADAENSRSCIQAVCRMLEIEGVHGLRVDDLTADDLPSLGWSGTPLHLVSVRRANLVSP